MTKYCPNCWGTGKIPDFWDNTKEVSCPRCKGTGKVLPITNEKWLDTLTTSDKAICLAKVAKKYGGDHQLWENWLKETHYVK